MKTIFKTSFEKDLKKVVNQELKHLIIDAIENVETASNIQQINDIKKLKGYKTYYRIRIKDYRIGLNIENNTVFFVRLQHRKDIYKVFP